MSEYHLHIAILNHIQSAFPQCYVWHTPNQSRDATEAFFNKKMGVRPGVSDLIIIWKGGNGALEIKSATGRLSSAQNKFLSSVSNLGWHTGEARTVRGAHMVLSSWGLKAIHTTIGEPDLRTDKEKIQSAIDMNRSL